MSSNSGFVDLRLNGQENQLQEGFWPSFTDIMTVVVMIFMMAMVILLLRNIELVRQLRATMEAERSAVELARSTGEERESLALRLIEAENQLAMERIKLMRLSEQSQQQESTINDQTDRISQLSVVNEDLNLRRDQLEAENFSLNQLLLQSETRANRLEQERDDLNAERRTAKQQLTDTQNRLASLQADLDRMKGMQETINQQLANLEQRYSQQSLILMETRSKRRQTGSRLNSLRGEYDELKVKYDRLVRPARSPRGRYLVEVRFSKAGEKTLIEYSTTGRTGFEFISQEKLEQRLTKLKNSKSIGLYIKVIFPEDSGLSFDEAWSFTSDLHSRYDYYSQGTTPPASPDVPLNEPGKARQ